MLGVAAWRRVAMRLLLADDHRLVREALVKYLSDAWPDTAVSEASTLADALQRVADGPAFDLVLLDLWMPGMNGLEGIAAMRRAAPGTRVILLSGDLDAALALEAVERGVDGVLTKDVKGQTMLDAIQRVLAGETFMPSALCGGAAALRDSRAEETRRRRQALGSLSEREYEILTLLSTGLNNKQIAASLGVSEGTVKLHLNHVFEKSGARNRADAVRLFFEAKAEPRERSGVR